MPNDDAPRLKILLVEDNPTHAHIIERHMKKSAAGMELEQVQRLDQAIERMDQGDIDALLLDLSLPDSEIKETLPKVIAAHGEMPIIVLTSLDDMEFATHAVGQGAQDFLVKSDINGPLLIRSIHYAMERKKTQERLESYAAELESSNVQLRGFAHTVAHEVKSPLTVFSACLHMLEEHYRETISAEHWEFAEDAATAMRGLTAMVNDLLEFSRMNTDPPNLADVDTEAVFYHAYVCLRPAIKQEGAVITHDPLPLVRGNENQLRQLLLNLIGNAIKYRSQEVPKIHISAVEAEGQFIFSVRDNGLGIGAEDLHRVFETFVRVHPQEKIEGSGIGLALCQRIVSSHGGRIWVESQPGVGSTFYFTIPKPG